MTLPHVFRGIHVAAVVGVNDNNDKTVSKDDGVTVITDRDKILSKSAHLSSLMMFFSFS